MMDNLPSEHFPDICASIVKASYAEKLQVLDAVNLSDRLKKTLPLLVRQIEVCDILARVHARQLVTLIVTHSYLIRKQSSWCS